MNDSKLTDIERTFCYLVSRIIVANPFCDERRRLVCELTAAPKDISKDELNERVVENLFLFVDKMLASDRANVHKYSGKDLRLVELTLIFELFYRLFDDFYQLIEEELKGRSRPVTLPFFEKAQRLFQRRGFSGAELLKYLPLFFQISRAYYFIDRNLIGTSECMKTLRRELWNNVFTCDLIFYHENLQGKMEDFSTLLLGDTGTGKGTAAAAIGRSGFIPFDAGTRRFKESFADTFVPTNLSQFSASLIESELFGHQKGAFTGAIESHEGIFSKCSTYGAIFLDEIGDISVSTQIKLLKVLQERIFFPVGSHEVKQFKGRVIAATHKDINLLRQSGVFRNDFYYRLCSDIIPIPTLSRRVEDDPDELLNLIDHVTCKIVGVHNPELEKEIHDIILKKVGLNYQWSGNVRELEQCIRRIIIKKDYSGDNYKLPQPDLLSELIDDMRTEAVNVDSLLSQYCRFLYKRHGTFETVGKILAIDRRTVKKYIGDCEF